MILWTWLVFVSFQHSPSYAAGKGPSAACEKYLRMFDTLEPMVVQAKQAALRGEKNLPLANQLLTTVRQIEANRYHGKSGTGQDNTLKWTVTHARSLVRHLEQGEPLQVTRAPAPKPKLAPIEKYERTMEAIVPKPILYGDFTESQTGIKRVYMNAVRSQLFGDGKLLRSKTHWMIRFGIVVDTTDERFDGLRGRIVVRLENQKKRQFKKPTALRALAGALQRMNQVLESEPLPSVGPGEYMITLRLTSVEDEILFDHDDAYLQAMVPMEEVVSTEDATSRLTIIRFLLADWAHHKVGSVNGGESRYPR